MFAIRNDIEEIYDYATMALAKSIKEKNPEKIHYWKERVIHLMGELNEVDKRIIEMTRAGSDDAENRPILYGTE